MGMEPVADAERGNPALEQSRVDRRRSLGVDGRRTAGEDDRLRPAGQHLLYRHRVRDELAVDARLPHSAGAQLRVLRTEVDYEDRRGLAQCRATPSALWKSLRDP